MKKYIVFIIVAQLFCLSIYAQSGKSKKLTRFINHVLKETEIIPAVSVSVTSSTKTLYANGSGTANFERQVLANKETLFYNASCTKSFTALVASILANEGKIKLTDQILLYKPFSTFKNKEVFKNLTISDLLSCQSGLDNTYISARFVYSGEYTEEKSLELMDAYTRSLPKGKAFEYSNFGYYIFGMILKAELGKSWQQFFEEKVFKPLGMKYTTCYFPNENLNTSAIPYSTIFPGQVERAILFKADNTMHAAGGMLTNAVDMARYNSFILNKGKLNGKQIYAPEIIEQVLKQQAETPHPIVKVFDGYGYALGWRLGKYEKQNVIYHFGGYAGWFAHNSLMPVKDLGVSILVNHDYGMPIADIIAKYAYDLYSGNVKKYDVYVQELENIKKDFKKQQELTLSAQKSRAERKWELSLPMELYQGEYYNDRLGTLYVTYSNGKLVLRQGNMNAIATAFNKKDCVRVEMIPNSGSVISFQISESQKEAKSLAFLNEVFNKVK